MGTDYYPKKDGHIEDGLLVGFCKAATSITVNSAVAIGNTTVSGVISVVSASFNTGVGWATKAANTNDMVPVVFYGIVKAVGSTSVAISTGQSVVSDTTAGRVTNLAVMNATTTCTLVTNSGTGTIHILGMALQAATTDADEILILVGGAR